MLKNQGYLPNETFKQYLDTIASKAQFDALIEEKAPKGQMALFSKGEVDLDQNIQRGLERQAIYDKFSPKLKILLDKYAEAFKNALYVEQGRWAGKEGQSLKIKEGRAAGAYEKAFKEEFPNFLFLLNLFACL